MVSNKHEIGPPSKLAYGFREAAKESSLLPCELSEALRAGEIEYRKIHGRKIISGKSLRDYLQRVFDEGIRYG
jgi:hypothetical protein